LSETAGHHLAQVNVARLLAPVDSPRIADFVAALAPINALAEQSPGFVWRLQDDGGDATSIRVFDDEMIMINLSVWESTDALKEFVYRTDHRDYFRRRAEWFEPMDRPYAALWWVPPGHRPTTTEAVARLERLRSDGPTEQAFTFSTLPGVTAD
jgi:hypothetical protein